MSIGIIIAGIIAGVIGTLTFVILTIIALASGNRRNTITFSSLFVMSLIIAILSIVEMVGRVAQKVKTGAHNFAEKIDEIKYEEDKEASEYRDWLKSITPAEHRAAADSSFYDTFDMDRNVYCIPMVYPYRLEMDAVSEGYAKLAIVKGTPPPGLREMESVTEAAFDKNFLLMKRDYSASEMQPPAEMPEVSYILFEFATGKSTVYYNKQKLLEEAEKAGYTGSKNLEETDTLYYKLI
jgi:hypothetical protein